MTSMMVARRGIVAKVFTPASIAGLQAWWDASQLTGLADGDPVSSFTDQSGNSRHASQATSAKRPAYKTGIVNGKPVLRFDGVDDVMAASFTLAQPLTLVAVVKSATTSGQHHILDSSGTRAVLYQKLGNWYTYAGTAERNSGIAVDTSAHVLSFSFDNTSRPEYVDGVAGASVNPGSGAFSGGAVYIGNDGAANYWSGDVAELLVYDSALGTVDRTALQAYLKAKWGTP